jgi:hypothetical protein
MHLPPGAASGRKERVICINAPARQTIDLVLLAETVLTPGYGYCR